MSVSEWLFLLLRPTDEGDLDDVVRTEVAALATHARERGATRWFFLRYSDESGPHVRFRALATPSVVEELVEAAALLARSVTPALAVYEPEWDKYGGASGVQVAERVFEASSSVAVALVEADRDRSERASAALALMTSIADVFIPAGTHREFWSRYARYWAQLASAEGRRKRPNADTSLERSVRRAVPDYAAGVSGAYLEAAGDVAGLLRAGTIEHTSAHWLFHLAHLTNNRLGFGPNDEVVLAEVLASDGRV